MITHVIRCDESLTQQWMKLNEILFLPLYTFSIEYSPSSIDCMHVRLLSFDNLLPPALLLETRYVLKELFTYVRWKHEEDCEDFCQYFTELFSSQGAQQVSRTIISLNFSSHEECSRVFQFRKLAGIAREESGKRVYFEQIPQNPCSNAQKHVTKQHKIT